MTERSKPEELTRGSVTERSKPENQFRKTKPEERNQKNETRRVMARVSGNENTSSGGSGNHFVASHSAGSGEGLSSLFCIQSGGGWSEDEVDGMSRLRLLYPETEVEELPRCWSSKDKANFISLSENNLKVHYKGVGKGHKDAAAVRATHAIPVSCLIYYFEIEIISKGRDGYMGIGLAGSEVNMQRLPGWDKESYGYHGDDGNSFCSSGTGMPYGPTFTTGDIIGCGYNLVENTCFYTKNGLNLGRAFSDLPPKPLFPTVGLQTPGEEVEANFGMKPFCYDIEDDLKALKQRITSSIMDFPVKYNEWQTTVHKLVQSWLVHNGYCATAEVFSCATRQPFTENVSNIKQRLRIQQLVLSGKIGEAILLTNKLYPDVLKSNPNLLFALKCRQFVEMVAGAASTCDSVKNPTCDGVRNPTCDGVKNPTCDSVKNSTCDTNGTSSTIKDTNGTLSIKNTTTATTSFNGHPSTDCNGNGAITGSEEGMETDEDEMISSSTSQVVNGLSSNGLSSNGLSGDGLSSNGVSSNGVSGDSSKHGGRLGHILQFGKELHALSQSLRKELGPNEVNAKMLREAFSLVAYREPASSPLGWLMSPCERETVCQQLNNAIVISEMGTNNHRPPLESIIKHSKHLIRLNGQSGAWLIHQL